MTSPSPGPSGTARGGGTGTYSRPHALPA
jgi:hypothetical protein